MSSHPTPADVLASLCEALRLKQVRTWSGDPISDIIRPEQIFDYTLYDISLEPVLDELFKPCALPKEPLIVAPARQVMFYLGVDRIFGLGWCGFWLCDIYPDPDVLLRVASIGVHRKHGWRLGEILGAEVLVDGYDPERIQVRTALDTTVTETAKAGEIAADAVLCAIQALRRLTEREIEYVYSNSGREADRIATRRNKLGLPPIPPIKRILHLRERKVIRPVEPYVPTGEKRGPYDYFIPEWPRRLSDGRVITARRKPELLTRAKKRPYIEVRP